MIRLSCLLWLIASKVSAQNNQLPIQSLKQEGALQAIQQALNDKFSISGGTLANKGGITLSSVTFQDGTVINSANKFVAVGGSTVNVTSPITGDGSPSTPVGINQSLLTVGQSQVTGLLGQFSTVGVSSASLQTQINNFNVVAGTQTVSFWVDNFISSVTGSQTVFTLTNVPTSTNSITMILDGLFQLGGVDYTYTSPKTITMTTAPAAGTVSFFAQYTLNTSTLPAVFIINGTNATSSTDTWGGVDTFNDTPLFNNGLVSSAITTTGTTTVKGNAFSVGGSSFTVTGGSATVIYQLTSGSLNITGPQGFISNQSSITTTGSFFGNGSSLAGIPSTASINAQFILIGASTQTEADARLAQDITIGTSTNSLRSDLVNFNTILTTLTVVGNAMSVGSSSFTVTGGSATVAFRLTAGSLSITGAQGFISTQSSITTTGSFFGDGSQLTNISGALAGGTNGRDAYWTGATTLGVGPANVTTSSITIRNGNGFLLDGGSTMTVNSGTSDFLLGSSTATIQNALPMSNLIGAWAVFIGSASNNSAVQIISSYNVASVNHTGTGVYQVNFGKAFSTTVSYTCVCSVSNTGGNSCGVEDNQSGFVQSGTTYMPITTNGAAGGAANVNRVSIICLGYQ